MAIIEGINTSIEIFKKLKEVNEKIKNVEIQMLIADLGLELAEIKNDLAELLNENRELKDKIKNLTSKNEDILEFKNGYYFKGNGEGPFCPGCYDSKKEVFRLVENNRHFSAFGKYKCPVCAENYK